jgi:hypothetical protein
MSSQYHSTTWIIAYSTSSMSHIWLPRRQKMSSHFLSKPRNIDLSTTRKSHFEQPEERNWVLSAILQLETSFSRSRQSRIFGLPKGRQSCPRVYRNHETTLYRLQPSRILWRPEGMKWVLRALRSLETLFYRLYQCRILRHPEDNEFSEPFDHLNHNFLELVQVTFFEYSEGRKLFRISYRPLEPSLYRLNAGSILGQPEFRYWILSAVRPLESSLSPSIQTRILGLPEGRTSCLRMFRNHETSIYRLNQVLFCGAEKEGNFSTNWNIALSTL